MATTADDAESPPLLAGRYELGPRLGRGGMADVYQATDTLLSRPVAVKVLREHAADESDRARFTAEARTLAGLSHSGLVTILDAGFGTDEGPDAAPDQPFLVMELVEGRSLSRAIADGPLPLDEVAAIGVRLADALAHVHAHGIVHRDVKPGNVLLGRGQLAKLADFGIARLLGDTARHTRTGHVIGTAAYFAPEQVSGEEVSGATDVYSLALVLLEAITGRLEYPGSPGESAIARLARPPRLPDDLPPSWRGLLASMTEQDPARRPSAADVADHLRGQSTAPMAAPLPPPPPPPPPPVGEAAVSATSVRDRMRAMSPAQRRAIVGAAAALVLVLLLVVVLSLGGGDDGDGATPTEVPSDVPSELREPLEELHDAVNGVVE